MAERLNLARDILRWKPISEAATELSRVCSISPRQAYRYLERAQHLKGPVSVVDAKVAFTVKLSRALIDRLRGYATLTRLSLSNIVSKAVLVLLKRVPKRG
jgi:hypothetical protein